MQVKVTGAFRVARLLEIAAILATVYPLVLVAAAPPSTSSSEQVLYPNRDAVLSMAKRIVLAASSAV